LVGAFGALALILATVGIYSVVSYTVSLRTREVGIRLALGAVSNNVVLMILRQVGITALCGVAAGLGISFWLTQMIGSLLFGVKPTDPMTISAVVALIFGVTLAASYCPARRAAKLDPMSAIRRGD
jgi:ABC-type antimicrobial peptide transport system permease subunit